MKMGSFRNSCFTGCSVWALRDLPTTQPLGSFCNFHHRGDDRHLLAVPLWKLAVLQPSTVFGCQGSYLYCKSPHHTRPCPKIVLATWLDSSQDIKNIAVSWFFSGRDRLRLPKRIPSNHPWNFS